MITISNTATAKRSNKGERTVTTLMNIEGLQVEGEYQATIVHNLGNVLAWKKKLGLRGKPHVWRFPSNQVYIYFTNGSIFVD